MAPGPQKFTDFPEDELTKLTKTVSVNFVRSTSGQSQKILAPEPEVSTGAERAAANAVLCRAGVRLMTLPGCVCVGIWSDLDWPEVREALRVFGSDTLPVRYLDGDVPMQYKLRRVPGEPVPSSVLVAMQQASTEPWKVRDRMMTAMGPDLSWAERKARSLNRLFKEQGVTRQPGRITAATVRHSERKERSEDE